MTAAQLATLLTDVAVLEAKLSALEQCGGVEGTKLAAIQCRIARVLHAVLSAPIVLHWGEPDQARFGAWRSTRH